jgi:universal stress protein A
MDYQNILAAIDFSESAPEVLQRAIELAGHYQAKLSVIHVVEYIPPVDFSGDPMSIPVGMIDESLLVENAKKSLEKFLEKHSASHLDHQVTIGLAKQDICQQVDDQKIDLLVIGSHGRHGLGRLLGSTVNGVLNSVSCDVLAVRLKG